MQKSQNKGNGCSFRFVDIGMEPSGTQQAFLLVVVFAAAEAVCAALIFGAFKNRTRSVR